MSDAEPRLPTIGELSRELQVEEHQVTYAIRSRGIRPASRAGRLRVFGEEQKTEIREALQQIAERRRSK